MIRENMQLLKKDIHIVVHIPKSGIDLTFDELKREFYHLLAEAHILE